MQKIRACYWCYCKGKKDKNRAFSGSEPLTQAPKLEIPTERRRSLSGEGQRLRAT